MNTSSIKRFALCVATVCSVGGCGYLRQGESISRCTDCATALYRDTGSGGSIYNVARASEDAVGRVARRYCTEHGLGQPTVGKRFVPPMGSGFWGYDFSCGEPGEAPVDRAKESTGPSLQQVRQQQREQAIGVLRQGLDSLAQPPAACELPATMTIKLPCGDVVSCTKRGDQVSCD